MKQSDRYARIVQWSDEDRILIGSCPDLMDGGCHGSDEKAVFAELCKIVEEVIELYPEGGEPLPEPTLVREVMAHLPHAA